MKILRQLTGSRAPAGRIVPGKFLRAALMSALLYAPVACSSSEATGPTGGPTGKWAGSIVTGTFKFSMNFVLLEDAAGKVTGNGFLQSENSGQLTSTAAVTVTGTFVSPNLSINLASQGFNTMNLSGPVSGNTITAVLNGSGFFNETIVLGRQ
jgi:hypothetical protein